MRQRDVFLDYVVRTMVAAIESRRDLVNILKDVGIDSVVLMGNELEKETGKSVVSKQNFLNIKEKKKIEKK